MRLKDGFLTHRTGGEQVMVAAGGVGFSGLVRSNHTAAFIVDQLKRDTTREQIIDAVLKQYEDAPLPAVERDVDKVLDTLRSIGALDE